MIDSLGRRTVAGGLPLSVLSRFGACLAAQQPDDPGDESTAHHQRRDKRGHNLEHEATPRHRTDRIELLHYVEDRCLADTPHGSARTPAPTHCFDPCTFATLVPVNIGVDQPDMAGAFPVKVGPTWRGKFRAAAIAAARHDPTVITVEEEGQWEDQRRAQRVTGDGSRYSSPATIGAIPA
ncbi:hypothetical protein [Streptosporangium subroseum]|uniref:hypothetical protein n=1 Tax=Streptosporangium subroseum TaxID=106412 RepID=UPI00308AE67E|nr:hypothetical protein OHB15_23960 [Streptosporangium subroseum]